MPFLGDWKSITPGDANKTFSEINNQVNSIHSFSVSVIQRTFQNYTTTKWTFQYDGYIKKEGENYRSLLMNIHTLQNSKFKVVIDTVQKIILVSNPGKKVELSTMGPQTEKALESTMKIRVKTDQETSHMEFSYPDSYAYHQIDLIYDKNMFPISFHLLLNNSVTVKTGTTEKTDKPRIEINYLNLKKGQKFSQAEFSEKRYFTEVNNKLVLSQQYKTYTLKDLRVPTQK